MAEFPTRVLHNPNANASSSQLGAYWAHLRYTHELEAHCLTGAILR